MEAASIGIIGGADGPTAIFVAADGSIPVLCAAVILAAAAALVIILRRRKHRK